MASDLDIQHAERLAALEQRAKSIEEDVGDMMTSQGELHDDMKSLKEMVAEMNTELARYRGMVGGAMLVVSAVWAFLTFAWDHIVKAIKGD